MEEEPESRFEKWLVDKFGEKMMTVLMWFAEIGRAHV